MLSPITNLRIELNFSIVSIIGLIKSYPISRFTLLIFSIFCFFNFTLSPRELFSQTQKPPIHGTGKIEFHFQTPKKDAIPNVIVTIKNQSGKFTSDSSGNLLLTVPTGKIGFTFVADGYATENIRFGIFKDSTVKQTIILDPEIPMYDVSGVEVSSKYNTTQRPNINAPTDQRLPIKPGDITEIPLGSLERLLSTLGGVSIGNEFSTQYRVRGGNFDENLIYINGIEIYRPMIVRTGQQEGLPITNPVLTKDVTFNSGGFPAAYGDKLSSVLNVEYQTPNKFAASAELGLLSQNAHVEGSTKNSKDSTSPGRVSYLLGVRRFSPSYLLNTLNTTGTYQPRFYDAQGLLTFKPKGKSNELLKYKTRKDGSVDTIILPIDRKKWSLFGILTHSKFSFNPQNRETTFGTVTGAIRLFVAFEGQEQTNYTTGQAAIIYEYKPTFRLTLKNSLSFIRSVESEISSVEGGYRLGDVNTDMGSKSFNEVIAIRGVGTELRNARNYLTVNLINIEHRGELKLDRDFYKKLYSRSVNSFQRHQISWGIKLQSEIIDDIYREWSAIDSADFVRQNDLIFARNSQHTFRGSGFFQYTWRTGKTTNLITGIRGNYWTLNKEFLFSPRIQFVYDPTLKLANPDSARHRIQFRLATGMYSQPPFFRELRNFQGVLDPGVRAQKSIHFIAGFDYTFRIWDRDFKLYVEGYYKRLLNIIPYEIENVRIRYYPQQTGTGYSYGIDTRINGQFIQGIESWFSFSVLKTEEDVTNDFTRVFNEKREQIGTVPQGLVPRPSDQRFNLGFYFQDEFPRSKTLKVHVNYVFNSGLPFGPPQKYSDRTTFFRAPSYHRVDIGISKLLIFRSKHDVRKKFSVESLWIGLEVFNLLQRENTVSYTWISAVNGEGYAVPNYLSNRLISLRAVLRL